MIKKKLYILMLSLLITASLTPVSASEKTLQDDGTYHIVSVERMVPIQSLRTVTPMPGQKFSIHFVNAAMTISQSPMAAAS